MRNPVLTSTLYHGTSSDFLEFSIEHCGSKKGVGFPLGYLGIYFTPCPKLASMFCKNKWNSPRSTFKKGARVIPVVVASSKVKVIHPMEWLPYSGSTPEEIISMRNKLLSEGYDCIIIESSEKYCADELYEPQVVVLKPEIIKNQILL